jgi:hypothetical protein
MSQADNAMLEKAIEVAVVSHAGQTDKNGEAYILHPLRVMLALCERGGTVEQQAAAVLHDVIEHCEVPDDFLAERFPDEVCDLVDALTKIDGEEYVAFLRRAAHTPGALLIEEADIQDNYGRLHLVRDEAVRAGLQDRYEQALELLLQLTQREEQPGFLHITVAKGEALVFCSDEDIQVLRIETIDRGQLKYRLQNQTQQAKSQQPLVISVGNQKVSCRLAVPDSRSPYVEALVDGMPDSIRVVREQRITFPAVAESPLPDLPRPHLFLCAVDDVISFKGPDASTVTVKVGQFGTKKRSASFEVNRKAITRQFYETFYFRLSGRRLASGAARPGG